MMPIETPSLILRYLVPEDVSKVFLMSQEQGMRTWLPTQVYRNEEHAASVLDFLISHYGVPKCPTVGPFVLGVQLKGTGELVGHVGLSPFGEAVEIGFAIEKAYQRKGFAVEAVQAISRWAIDEFQLGTILGITAAHNVASQGALLRAGYSRTKEEVLLFQGLVQPVVFFVYNKKH